MTNRVRYHGDFATVGINLGDYRKSISYTGLSGDETVEARFAHGPLILTRAAALAMFADFSRVLGANPFIPDMSGIAAHLEGM